MERVSAQCMLFPTPLSKQEFAKLAQFKYFSKSSGVRVHSANRKPIDGLLPDLLYVKHFETLYLSPYSMAYIRCKIPDLDLGRLKAIRCQSS